MRSRLQYYVHGYYLLSIPFSWEWSLLFSIHLLIAGTTTICKYPASWSQLICSSTGSWPSLGSRALPILQRPLPQLPTAAERLSKLDRRRAFDAQHPQLRRCWTHMIKIPWSWTRETGYYSPFCPEIEFVTFSTVWYCVCEITAWRPAGWFGLEELISKDPNSSWEGCFPTLSLNLLNWELEMAVGEVGNGWDNLLKDFLVQKMKGSSHQR